MSPRMLALCALLPMKSCVAQCRSCACDSSPRSIFSIVGCDRSVRLLRSSLSISPLSCRVPFSTSMSIPLLDGSRIDRSALGRELIRDVAPQFSLLDLADVGERQFRYDLDSLGPFELSHPARREELAHGRELKSFPISQRQIGASFLAENGIGHRHDRRGADCGMRNQ